MNKKSGFTLIEIVIILAILGILSLVAISRYQNIRINSQAQTNEAVAIQILNAAESRWVSIGVEPNDISELEGNLVGSLVADGYLREWPGSIGDYTILGNNGVYKVAYPVPSGADIKFDGIVGD